MSGTEQCPTEGAAGSTPVSGPESSAGGDHHEAGSVHHGGHGERTNIVRGSTCKLEVYGGGICTCKLEVYGGIVDLYV